MNVNNFATASVVATAGGTEILSSTLATAAATAGMNCIVINPSVDIALVDAGGASPISQLPGAVAGTYANSPLTIFAGVPTTVLHRGGPIRAISSSGTATVKWALGCVP